MKRLHKRGGDGAVRNPAGAVIKWLNESPKATVVSGLVQDAKCVVEVLSAFKSLREFNSARRHGKLPTKEKEFWKAYQRLNDTLREFLHAPQIDVNIFYEDEPVYWMVAADDASALAPYSIQVRCLLRLIGEGSLDKIRSCEYCKTWYCARVSAQRFCTPKCRWNAFASDPAFMAERRAYEKKRYRLHVSGKVATKAGK